VIKDTIPEIVIDEKTGAKVLKVKGLDGKT